MSGGPPFKFDRGRNVCLDRRGEEVCLLTDVRSIWNTLQTDPKFAGTKVISAATLSPVHSCAGLRVHLAGLWPPCAH